VLEAEQNTWSVIPMAVKLDDIDPIYDAAINPEGVGNAPEWSPDSSRWSRIVVAWNGMSYNMDADEAWMLHCGGHTDYGGNEVLACDFNSDAPEWRMVRKPSGAIGNEIVTLDGLEGGGVYSDGRPRSSHSYNVQLYVPGLGPILIGCPGPWYAGGGLVKWMVIVDETDGEPTFTPQMSVISTDNLAGSGCCYDPHRNCVWLAQKGNNALVKIIPGAGNDWTNCSGSAVGSAISKGSGASIAYHPESHCLLIGNNTNSTTHGSYRVFDPENTTLYTPTNSGSVSGGLLGGDSQPRWVETLGAFCVWDNASSTTLITRITLGANPRTDAMTIDALTVAGGNAVTPSAKTANGTFGRFAHSERFGGFILFNSVSGDTYFYKY
jgi:hypothetical protein